MAKGVISTPPQITQGEGPPSLILQPWMLPSPAHENTNKFNSLCQPDCRPSNQVAGGARRLVPLVLSG